MPCARLAGVTAQADALVELTEQFAAVRPLGDWVEAAACRDETDLLVIYPKGMRRAERIESICSPCPVRRASSDGRADRLPVVASFTRIDERARGQP